jgi:hypothetical protein
MTSRPHAHERDQERIPVARQETTDIINHGHREFADMAPSMLKKNVVALVFLPWLTRYTGRLIRSAKEEERRAILAALPPDADVPQKDSQFLRGHNNALKLMRDIILTRGEAPRNELG